MSLGASVARRTTVRVWHASRDSRVGIAAEYAPGLYSVQLLNQPNFPAMRMGPAELERDWLEAPRIDVAWMNIGSVWVPNIAHKFWNKPVPKKDLVVISQEIGIGGTVAFQDKVNKRTFYSSCYQFMLGHTRLWGAETKKGEIPVEPLPYQSRKLPGRPKRVKPEPKSALDRLLERD